jgi:hypothetical protein
MVSTDHDTLAEVDISRYVKVAHTRAFEHALDESASRFCLSRHGDRQRWSGYRATGTPWLYALSPSLPSLVRKPKFPAYPSTKSFIGGYTSAHVGISVPSQARRGYDVVFRRQQIMFLGKGSEQAARGLRFDFTTQRGAASLERDQMRGISL